jgi:hypothetical protein
MFPNLFSLISRKPEAYERAFVKEVNVRRKVPRNKKVERLLLICWVAIVFKSFGVLWLFDHYHVPINPLWVIGPTVTFASLCTLVYILRG